MVKVTLNKTRHFVKISFFKNGFVDDLHNFVPEEKYVYDNGHIWAISPREDEEEIARVEKGFLVLDLTKVSSEEAVELIASIVGEISKKYDLAEHTFDGIKRGLKEKGIEVEEAKL